MPPTLDAAARRLAREELIGRSVTVSGSSDPTLVGLAGVVVDETRETLLIRCPDGADRRVAKAASRFAFDTGDGPVEIPGRRIRFRPEDRIKRIR